MPSLRVVVTSQPRGGKTTLCRKVLERLRQGHPGLHLDGFLSCEVRGSNGSLVGYQLYSLDGELCETIASSDGPQSAVTVSKYNVYVDAIERVTLPVLERALDGQGPRIFLLDDIGAMTCRSTAFAARARALLEMCDPELSVLASAGWAGSGLAAECRRLPGVTSITIDEENRDSLPESLAARFEAAATSELDAPPRNGEGVGGDGSEEDDEGDLTSFDAWGADARCFGVRRGFYDPRSQPPAACSTSVEVTRTKAVDEVPSQQSSADTQSLPAVDSKPAPSGDDAWGSWGGRWWSPSKKEEANACGGTTASWAWPDARAHAANMPNSPSDCGNWAEHWRGSPTDSACRSWGTATWRGSDWASTKGWASNGWYSDSWKNQGSGQGEEKGANDPPWTGQWSTGAWGARTWDSGWAAVGIPSQCWGTAARGDAVAGSADLKGGAPERVSGSGSRGGDTSWCGEATQAGR